MRDTSYYINQFNIRNAIKNYYKVLTIKDKITLSVLLVILVIVFIIVKKSVTLSMIIGKTKYYERLPNVYQEIINDATSDIKKYQIYKKDDKVKTISISRRNIKTTKYYDGNSVKTYTDSGTSRTATSSSGVINEENVTVNYLGTTSLSDIITNTFTMKISSEDEEGISCYVLEGVQSNNAYYVEDDVQNVKLYIEKSTNLPIKIVEELENGKIRVTNFRYEFDVVTDKDMKEPGASQYRVTY